MARRKKAATLHPEMDAALFLRLHKDHRVAIGRNENGRCEALTHVVGIPFVRLHMKIEAIVRSKMLVAPHLQERFDGSCIRGAA